MKNQGIGFLYNQDDAGNKLIDFLTREQYLVIVQVALLDKPATISDVARYADISKTQVHVAINRLIDSELISLTCDFDDFVFNHTKPIITLHTENAAKAIKYFLREANNGN